MLQPDDVVVPLGTVGLWDLTARCKHEGSNVRLDWYVQASTASIANVQDISRSGGDPVVSNLSSVPLEAGVPSQVVSFNASDAAYTVVYVDGQLYDLDGTSLATVSAVFKANRATPGLGSLPNTCSVEGTVIPAS